jgi:hypothetical protein
LPDLSSYFFPPEVAGLKVSHVQEQFKHERQRGNLADFSARTFFWGFRNELYGSIRFRKSESYNL